MELEIVSRKDNPLLERVELEVKLHHQDEPTPERETVREQVAAALKAKKDSVVVDHMDTTFGMGLTRGYVKVYSSKQAALDVEERSIAVRNKLAKPVAAPKPTKAAAPPAEGEAPEDEGPAKEEAPAEEGSD
jgi:small subunit ribosomal protein S24e